MTEFKKPDGYKNINHSSTIYVSNFAVGRENIVLKETISGTEGRNSVDCGLGGSVAMVDCNISE